MECSYIRVSADQDVLVKTLKEAEFCLTTHSFLLYYAGHTTHHLRMVSLHNSFHFYLSLLLYAVSFVSCRIISFRCYHTNNVHKRSKAYINFCFFFATGTFKLQMEFTEEYPNKPPTVRFISKMFHPNGKLSHGIFPWEVYPSFYQSSKYKFVAHRIKTRKLACWLC